jgi:hypothetical protein
MSDRGAIPILLNHDPAAAIGVVEWTAQGLEVRLSTPVEDEIFRRTFGRFGYKVLEFESRGETVFVRRAVILEWSVCREDPEAS